MATRDFFPLGGLQEAMPVDGLESVRAALDLIERAEKEAVNSGPGRRHVKELLDQAINHLKDAGVWVDSGGYPDGK